MFHHTNTPTLQARRLARERVDAGVAWLRKNAPSHWQRNLFDVGRHDDGTLYAMRRFRTAYDNEDVVSLAFEGIPGCSLGGRYVTAGGVREHFKLSSRDLYEMGFMSDEAKGLSCELLDDEWEKALTDHTRAAPRLGAEQCQWTQDQVDNFVRDYNERAPGYSLRRMA